MMARFIDMKIASGGVKEAEENQLKRTWLKELGSKERKVYDIWDSSHCLLKKGRKGTSCSIMVN